MVSSFTLVILNTSVCIEEKDSKINHVKMYNIFLYSPLHWLCYNYVQTKALRRRRKKECRGKEENRTVGEERS